MTNHQFVFLVKNTIYRRKTWNLSKWAPAIHFFPLYTATSYSKGFERRNYITCHNCLFLLLYIYNFFLWALSTHIPMTDIDIYSYNELCKILHSINTNTRTRDLKITRNTYSRTDVRERGTYTYMHEWNVYIYIDSMPRSSEEYFRCGTNTRRWFFFLIMHRVPHFAAHIKCHSKLFIQKI